MDNNKYVKNYKQFASNFGKSTDITQGVKLGKRVTLHDDREGVIVSVGKTAESVKIKFDDDKTEDVKIDQIK